MASALEDAQYHVTASDHNLQASKPGLAVIMIGSRCDNKVLITCLYTYCDNPKMLENEQNEIWDIRHPNSLNKIMEWLDADSDNS